jgi:uncharacterized protein (TIGR04255 family)
VEALCEFGFSPSGDWNQELVAALQAAYKSGFPERKDLKTIQAQVAVNAQGIHQGLLQGERIQFVSQDGASMVQVAPNTLTINDLKPYSGWDAFKPAILSALTTYQQVAIPTTLFRAHLRYINRIELDGPTVELDDWFQFSFRQPEVSDLPGAATYIVGAQYPFSENASLRVEVATAPSTDNNVLAAMLDLEYISMGENVLSFDDVNAWLEEAHSRIESAWLGSITEKLHLKYEPEAVQ